MKARRKTKANGKGGVNKVNGQLHVQVKKKTERGGSKVFLGMSNRKEVLKKNMQNKR